MKPIEKIMSEQMQVFTDAFPQNTLDRINQFEVKYFKKHQEQYNINLHDNTLAEYNATKMQVQRRYCRMYGERR